MTKFSLTISRSDEIETSAFGNVGLVSYAAKTAEFDAAESYTVSLTRKDETGNETTITSLTADGDTVSTVLKSKLAKERKGLKGSEDETAE
jgi:hypothetical protein